MEIRVATWSVLILFIGANVAAAAPDLNRFSGEAAEITFEGGQANGHFNALTINNYGGKLLAPPDFSLNGTSIVLETDQGTGLGGSFVATIPESDQEVLNNHRFVGVENRVHHSLTVFGEGKSSQIELEILCSSAEPSTSSFIEPDLYVDFARDPPRADTSQSVKWSTCDDEETGLVITGDFTVSLWEWDIRIAAPDGDSETRQTGEFPVDGERGALYPHASERRQIWLFVEDGELVVPHWDQARVFVDDIEAETQNVTLVRPEGDLKVDGEEVHVAGDRMDLSGDFVFDVDGKQDSLAARAMGQFSRVQVDGEALAWTTNPEDTRAGAFSILPLIALVATAILLVTGTVVWHTSPNLRSAVLTPLQRRRDVLFEQALTEGTIYNMDRLKKRRKWVKLSLRLRPNHPEALAAMGTILFHLKKYEKALDRFQQAIANMDSEHRPNEVPDDAVAFWAVECARCLGWMRLSRPREQWDDLSEKIMAHTHIAAKVDPEVASMLLNYPFLSDLTNAIIMAIDMGEHSVKP